MPITLQQKIKKLETLVAALEDESIDLDKAMAHYAEVIELSGSIMTLLQASQEKLQILHKEGEKWMSREESL
jgi:exodeoxyribonuclease VII small subunit